MSTGTIPPVPSTRLGMGALPYPGGVMFRVWAKFAPSVSVVGSFNSWATIANLLAPEGESGYWSVDVPGADVGDTYKFYIAKSANPYRMDPYARSIQKDNDGNMNGLIAPTSKPYTVSSYRTPNWNEAVVYELHIPTFTTQPDGKPGTFDSASEKLEALAAIGVNAIEIMPLGEFSGIQSTGYNPGYIFAVEDTFGGPDQFRDFVNQAHSKGIAVILDVVYNHLGETDLWQFDGWSPGNINCPYDIYSTNGGIYFYTDYRAHTDFGHSRFDMGRDEVCQYIVDNALRWLEDRFVDGLRFDSVVNIRAVQAGGQIKADLPDGKALLRRINGQVQASQGWKLTIAEDLQNDPLITSSLDDANAYGFGAQWSDSFYWNLRNTVTPSDDAARNLSALANSLSSLNGWNAFKSVLYSENHDRVDPNQSSGGRMNVLIDGGNPASLYAKKRSTLAAAVVLTAPGIPMLFQGQEFLETQPFPNSGSYPNPIHWGLSTQYSGISNLYRDLIHLRRNWFNNSRGLQGANINVLTIFDNILVYHRWNQGGPGDDVIVVCNFSNHPYSSYSIGFPRTGLWRVRLNSNSAAYDSYFENWNSFDTSADGPPLNGMPASGNIGIGAYSCVLFSQ